jgi:hypothetical protein
MLEVVVVVVKKNDGTLSVDEIYMKDIRVAREELKGPNPSNQH